MICISKENWNKLNALKGRFARYNGRNYKIIDWQITDGEVLLLGIYKKIEYSINYMTPFINKEERFFNVGDLI